MSSFDFSISPIFFFCHSRARDANTHGPRALVIQTARKCLIMKGFLGMTEFLRIDRAWPAGWGEQAGSIFLPDASSSPAISTPVGNATSWALIKFRDLLDRSWNLGKEKGMLVKAAFGLKVERPELKSQSTSWPWISHFPASPPFLIFKIASIISTFSLTFTLTYDHGREWSWPGHTRTEPVTMALLTWISDQLCWIFFFPGPSQALLEYLLSVKLCAMRWR